MHKLKRAAVLAMLVASFAAGCGGTDEPAATAAGNATDARFVNGMIPHHEGAIAMAELAMSRAERKAIKRLAVEILDSQQEEIKQMLEVQLKLPQNAGTMMSADAVAAMHRETEALAIAPDFDKDFIRNMIPHHEGAITMSRRLQLHGQSPGLRSMSRTIVATQTAEIADMRDWYEAWYGDPAPASKDGGHGGH